MRRKYRGIQRSIYSNSNASFAVDSGLVSRNHRSTRRDHAKRVLQGPGNHRDTDSMGDVPTIRICKPKLDNTIRAKPSELGKNQRIFCRGGTRGKESGAPPSDLWSGDTENVKRVLLEIAI